MANDIDNVEPPALPLPDEEYNRLAADQSNNVLRLFFNRLASIVNTLLSTDDGGKYLYMPRGSFYSTADQTAAAINTGYAVTFNNTNYSSNITLSNNSRLNVVNSGVYSFGVTFQIENNNSSDTTVTVYERKNGSSVSYSGHRFDVKGSDDFMIHWGFTASLAAGDYVEIYWATGDTQLNLHTEAATSPHPGLPSASVDIQYVSNS
tara:strand:+ start:5524 stop:6141 length:618 start_codon:yes stop_codon:yes gene_type:complete